MLAHCVSVRIKPSVVVDVAAQDLYIANFTHVKPRVEIVISNLNMIQDDVVAPIQPNLGSSLSPYPAGIWSQRALKDQAARCRSSQKFEITSFDNDFPAYDGGLTWIISDDYRVARFARPRKRLPVTWGVIGANGLISSSPKTRHLSRCERIECLLQVSPRSLDCPRICVGSGRRDVMRASFLLVGGNGGRRSCLHLHK